MNTFKPHYLFTVTLVDIRIYIQSDNPYIWKLFPLCRFIPWNLSELKCGLDAKEIINDWKLESW